MSLLKLISDALAYKRKVINSVYTDEFLIKNSLWGNHDGEPLNEFARIYSERHDPEYDS